LGYLLSQQLVNVGEKVLDVQPKLAAKVRLLESGSTNKNDPNDARSVAVAALRGKGVAHQGLGWVIVPQQERKCCHGSGRTPLRGKMAPLYRLRDLAPLEALVSLASHVGSRLGGRLLDRRRQHSQAASHRPHRPLVQHRIAHLIAHGRSPAQITRSRQLKYLRRHEPADRDSAWLAWPRPDGR
jgi:hypothetical protein